MYFRIFLCFLAVACYQPASVLTSEDILSIQVDESVELIANGENYLDITVETDERTSSEYPISLSTSSGILNFNVSEFSEQAKETTLFNDTTGEVTVKMRVGLEPGDVFLTATASVDGAGYLAQKTIFLGVSDPLTIEVNPLVFNVPADGTQNVRVETDVYGKALEGTQLATKVSYGTNYAIGVCCGTEENMVTCHGQPSLRAPQLQILDGSQRLNFDLLARRVEATPYVEGGTPTGSERSHNWLQPRKKKQQRRVI